LVVLKVGHDVDVITLALFSFSLLRIFFLAVLSLQQNPLRSFLLIGKLRSLRYDIDIFGLDRGVLFVDGLKISVL